jgi:UDP-2,3-diacylglucosamine hydrolase
MNGKKFFLAHGDGLGPGDHGYKFLKRIFEFPFNQWLFRWIHPDIGTRLGLYFSSKSRYAHITREARTGSLSGKATERLLKFSSVYLSRDPSIDYFIFGHHHLPLARQLTEKTGFFLIGDWITHFSYLVFDGEKVELRFYGKSLQAEPFFHQID